LLSEEGQKQVREVTK